MSKPWDELLELEKAGLLPHTLLSLWEKNSGSICGDILAGAYRQHMGDWWEKVMQGSTFLLLAGIFGSILFKSSFGALIFGPLAVVGFVMFFVGWAISTSMSGGIMRSNYRSAIETFYFTLNRIEGWSGGNLFRLAAYSEEQFRALATGILVAAAAEVVDFERKSPKMEGVLERIDRLNTYHDRFKKRYDTLKILGLVREKGGYKTYFDAAGTLPEHAA